MNDVLPKPFTKEGLITMLDKHLSHLKKHPAGSMSPMEPPPPQPLSAVSKRSMKLEESPATSPATTWHSPNHFSTGVSPASTHTDDHAYYGQGHYQQPIQPTPPLYNSAPGSAVGAPPPRPLQPQQPPRRNITDISGGPPEMGDAKRQHTYGPPQAHMGQPMQRPR